MTETLIDFTFHDTGKVVKIRKVSPMIAVDIDASIPTPEPPTQEVDYGPPKGKVKEPNYSDGGYLLALEERRLKVGRMVTKANIRRGVVIEGDDWKQEVSDYRKFIQDTTGAPLADEDDLYIYVTRICVGTQADLQDLFDAISKRSQPTEGAIEAAKDSFRG
jgi:hypothetical protein